MSGLYLSEKASKARLREAEQARRNRAEIVRELSWGRVSRRDLIRMGLFTAAGALAPIRGLSPTTIPAMISTKNECIRSGMTMPSVLVRRRVRLRATALRR